MTWWSALLGALSALAYLKFYLVNPLVAMMYLPAIVLSMKVRHRAVDIALKSLLSSYSSPIKSVKEGSTIIGDQSRLQQALYIRLHSVLERALENAVHGLSLGRIVLVRFIIGNVISGIIYVSAGSCLPLTVPMGILTDVIHLLIDLSSVATHNEEIRSIAALYEQA